MSRSDSRDDRDQANETPLGRMVLSQGRSGGATSANDEANQEQSTRCLTQQGTAAPRSLSIPSPEREQPTALSRSRDLVFLRNRTYRISSAERDLMTEVGKFRTIAVADLAQYRYSNQPGQLQQDLLNLKVQKLVR